MLQHQLAGDNQSGLAVNGAKIRIFWDRESAEGAKSLG
jgi:hypothetical protein